MIHEMQYVNLENPFSIYWFFNTLSFSFMKNQIVRHENFINSASFPLIFVTIYFVALKLSQNWYFPLNLFFKLQPMRDGRSKKGEFAEFESEMDDGFLAARFFQ